MRRIGSWIKGKVRSRITESQNEPQSDKTVRKKVKDSENRNNITLHDAPDTIKSNDKAINRRSDENSENFIHGDLIADEYRENHNEIYKVCENMTLNDNENNKYQHSIELNEIVPQSTSCKVGHGTHQERINMSDIMVVCDSDSIGESNYGFS